MTTLRPAGSSQSMISPVTCNNCVPLGPRVTLTAFARTSEPLRNGWYRGPQWRILYPYGHQGPMKVGEGLVSEQLRDEECGTRSRTPKSVKGNGVCSTAQALAAYAKDCNFLRHHHELIACHSFKQPYPPQPVHSQKDGSIRFLGQAVWLS
jgi:hypothetical protein